MKRRKQKGIARWTCADGRDHTGRAPTQREADIISANMSGRPCFGHSGRGRRVKGQKPVSLTFASVAQEWLNPMAEVEWKGTERRENVDPFTTHELRAIFAAADEINWNFGTMLRLWAGCGARAGEVSALQWQDLDPKNGTVLIRRTFSHHRVLAWTKTDVSGCRTS